MPLIYPEIQVPVSHCVELMNGKAPVCNLLKWTGDGPVCSLQGSEKLIRDNTGVQRSPFCKSVEDSSMEEWYNILNIFESNPPYNGCTCSCHSGGDIIHLFPCCYPNENNSERVTPKPKLRIPAVIRED